VREVDIVLVTRDIARGEILGAGDLRVERRTATRANLAAALDPATVAGNVVRRDVRSGEPVTPALIAVAPVVRAGRAVTVLWPGKGFAIEIEATALADARSGERIGLRRVHDGSVFSGIAQADGTVMVAP
jgi:flagella basal body P-ring formation protein FlgA